MRMAFCWLFSANVCLECIYTKYMAMLYIICMVEHVLSFWLRCFIVPCYEIRFSVGQLTVGQLSKTTPLKFWQTWIGRGVKIYLVFMTFVLLHNLSAALLSKLFCFFWTSVHVLFCLLLLLFLFLCRYQQTKWTFKVRIRTNTWNSTHRGL